jgi:hypothetical protein
MTLGQHKHCCGRCRRLLGPSAVWTGFALGHDSGRRPLCLVFWTVLAVGHGTALCPLGLPTSSSVPDGNPSMMPDRGTTTTAEETCCPLCCLVPWLGLCSIGASQNPLIPRCSKRSSIFRTRVMRIPLLPKPSCSDVSICSAIACTYSSRAVVACSLAF